MQSLYRFNKAQTRPQVTKTVPIFMSQKRSGSAVNNERTLLEKIDFIFSVTAKCLLWTVNSLRKKNRLPRKK